MPNWVGQQLGNYCLLRLLGKGGFGQVYLGEHIYLKTHVAVKLLREDINGTQTEAFRLAFLDEARKIAALKHPHILRVFEFSMDKFTPYLVMDYAAHGTLLERHPPGSKLSVARVISYIQPIAQALSYAHTTQLVHRDVKPANVLLDELDTILLSDFGLATIAHNTASMQTIANMGTASYMAPEQLQGHPVTASDQYALAVMVFEWLCGELPYQGDPISVGIQHLTTPVPSLRQLNRELSPAVEAVVQKAMAKDAKLRFASVLDFVHALEQANQAEPQTSNSASNSIYTPAVFPPAHTKSFVEPAPLTLGFDNPFSFALSNTANSIPALSLIHDSKGAAYALLANQEPLLNNSIANNGSVNKTRHVHANGMTLLTYGSASGKVYSVVWSPDGTRVASAGNDTAIRIWDVASGETLHTLSHGSAVYTVAWSPDGSRVASGGNDAIVRIWDVTTGQVLYNLQSHLVSVNAVVWSPDGRFIASASDDQSVLVWEAVSGKLIDHYEGHDKWVNAVTWSPDGKLLASASGDQTVQVWEAASGKLICRYDRHNSDVHAVAWSPDGKLLASASGDQTVRIWEATSGKLVRRYEGHSASVNAVTWSRDGKLLASASYDQTVQVWDAATGKRLLTYSGHTNGVAAVAWSPDGQRIASGAYDRTVQVWQAQ